MSLGYANTGLVFTLPFPCTVSSFTGLLWRVLHKQTSLVMTQAYPTLTTGESVLHVCVWRFWENAFDAGRDTSQSQSWRGEWRHASIWTYYAARTGHDMACTLLCHATRDTPLKDKFTQHLLNVVLPLHLRFPLLVLIALIFLHRCLQGWVMRPRL